jgi:hypothetical protein
MTEDVAFGGILLSAAGFALAVWVTYLSYRVSSLRSRVDDLALAIEELEDGKRLQRPQPWNNTP